MSKFAFVFPGQGSQSRGMMNGYDGFPVVQETFEEAGDIEGEPVDHLGTVLPKVPIPT